MEIDLEQISVQELTDGIRFLPEKDSFCCVCCGKTFAQGEIFTFHGRFFDAEHAVKLHLYAEHANRFEKMVHSESKYNTLTENQRSLLELMAAGKSDAEIASQLEISPSTVRHQKFIFREKAKQAKLYLAIAGMALGEKFKQEEAFVPVPECAKMIDDRYAVTKEERDKILKSVFSSQVPLRLKVFSSKEKKKLVTLTRIAEEFVRDRNYSETEVNSILKEIYPDFATLRRYLIEYGFMDRTSDCREYWLRGRS